MARKSKPPKEAETIEQLFADSGKRAKARKKINAELDKRLDAKSGKPKPSGDANG